MKDALPVCLCETSTGSACASPICSDLVLSGADNGVFGEDTGIFCAVADWLPSPVADVDDEVSRRPATLSSTIADTAGCAVLAHISPVNGKTVPCCGEKERETAERFARLSCSCIAAGNGSLSGRFISRGSAGQSDARAGEPPETSSVKADRPS